MAKLCVLVTDARQRMHKRTGKKVKWRSQPANHLICGPLINPVHLRTCSRKSSPGSSAITVTNSHPSPPEREHRLVELVDVDCLHRRVMPEHGHASIGGGALGL
jgi:hypothetical protein